MRKPSLLRRGVGVVAAAGVTATALLFILGSVNPWGFVLLQQYFGNPWLGMVLVGVGGYLAVWLLAPVRNEAQQRWRIRVRVTLAVLITLGILIGGITWHFYRYEHTELARSEDGQRALAQVVYGGRQTSELRLWEGSGLATREVATLGRACHGLEVRFVTPNLVAGDHGFGEWEIELDPDTGQPRQVLGPQCPDGPVPATLEE